MGAVSDCELKVEAGGEWARADMMGAAGFLFVQQESCGSLINNQGSRIRPWHVMNLDFVD